MAHGWCFRPKYIEEHRYRYMEYIKMLMEEKIDIYMCMR